MAALENFIVPGLYLQTAAFCVEELVAADSYGALVLFWHPEDFGASWGGSLVFHFGLQRISHRIWIGFDFVKGWFLVFSNFCLKHHFLKFH